MHCRLYIYTIIARINIAYYSTAFWCKSCIPRVYIFTVSVLRMPGHIPFCIPPLASDSLGSFTSHFSCPLPCLFCCLLLRPFALQNYTTNEKATVDQHFKELIRDLERQRDEVKAALDQREKIASENVKEIVDELEERAKLLREDKENREQIHQISDSVLFLQVRKISFAFPFPMRAGFVPKTKPHLV